MQEYEPTQTPNSRGPFVVAGLAVVALTVGLLAAHPPEATTPVAPPSGGPFPTPPELIGVDLNQQDDDAVLAKSANCVGCHQNARDPHFKNTVHLGCTDCH